MTKVFTCWFTGLPGAGKSTIAKSLSKILISRSVVHELIDGDEIRKHLSSDLGFSIKDREINVLRVGYLCTLLSKHNISTIVAMISPSRHVRSQLRQTIPNFIEIYVECPIEVCIQRDPKGLYARAIAGEIKEFTGISSPYEPPSLPELTVRTDQETLEQITSRIVKYLELDYME